MRGLKFSSYWMTPMFNDKSVSELKRIVCHYFKVTEDQLLSRSRKRNYVDARRAISYILYNRIGGDKMTYSEIGAILGNRNHATIISLVKSVEGFMSIDKGYAKLIESFK